MNHWLIAKTERGDFVYRTQSKISQDPIYIVTEEYFHQWVMVTSAWIHYQQECVTIEDVATDPHLEHYRESEALLHCSPKGHKGQCNRKTGEDYSHHYAE